MTMFKLLNVALLITGLGTASAAWCAEEGHAKHHTKAEGHNAMPAGTKGVSEGEIVSKEKGKLVLKTKDGNLLFMAHWRGGLPKDGGGLDQEMLATLERFKPGQRVKIDWSWQERRRIEQIAALE
jgi:hypothetical protein